MYKTKKEIKIWLDNCDIKNYFIEDDLSVSLENKDLVISNKKIDNIPIFFNNIETFECTETKLSSLPRLPDSLVSLICKYNNLKSIDYLPPNLEELDCSDNRIRFISNIPNNLKIFRANNNKLNNLPQMPKKMLLISVRNNLFTNLDWCAEHLRDSLLCDRNKITSLINGPKYIHNYFIANDNALKNLDGCPEYVGKSINLSNNKLTSLKCFPKIFNGRLDCSHNKLVNFKDCVLNFSGIDCSHNKLTSLEGIPEIINNDFNCSHNKLINFNFFPKTIDTYYFDISSNNIKDIELLNFNTSISSNIIKTDFGIFNSKDDFFNMINNMKLSKEEVFILKDIIKNKDNLKVNKKL